MGKAKKEPKATPDARALFKQFVQMIVDFNREEGIAPSEPVTTDTLVHAAHFVDGKPAEAK